MNRYSRKEKMRILIQNCTQEEDHFHQDIEVIYVLEGTMQLRMREHRAELNSEDIIVINANQRHGFQATEDILYVSLFIEYGLVGDVLGSADSIFWCDSTRDSGERYEKLRKAMKHLISNYMNTGGKRESFSHISLCYQIMDLLVVHFLLQASEREPLNKEEKFESRLSYINNYIRANYSQPISMKELSDKMYLSNGYLSRFFKKNYGMNFTEYLSNIRLYYAVEELLYTDEPITRIAYNNGFASVAIFNKLFQKKYKETPSIFRKNAKNPTVSLEKENNRQEIEDRLEKLLLSEEGMTQEEQKSGKKLAHFSVATCQPMQNCWGKMINGGTAEDLLRSEVREHLLILKEGLGFEYVRIWNIFSRGLYIDITADESELNFTRLDSILDYLIQIGLKPHIELGRKPKRIQGSVRDVLYMEEDMQEFQNVEQWDRILNSLMCHLVYRFGHQEVDSWRMEIWLDEKKEPSKDTWEEYFIWFSHACQTIRRHSNMEIGGYGIRVDYEDQQIVDFLKEWKKQEYQPDYLSAICFAYERGENKMDYYAKRSLDNEFLLHKIQTMKKLANQAGMGKVKLYITEWNLSISDRNYINDSCFKGAYIVKNILDAYGKIDELDYFQGSDHVAEYFDSNALLSGSMGLLSKDNILKPAGFAYDFLNRLYPYYIGHGDNYLISTNQHQTYGIICHNQKVLNYNYYFTDENQMDREHLWKYFDDKDSLELHFTLRDVEEGRYQMKVYRINEKSGSVLDIWAELGYEKELSRNDIKYFRRVCEPKLTMQKCDTENGMLKFAVMLVANEICFIKLNKLQ
ncbi:MAG: helix-turn-helix domain-containing protein [Lachnospiraceae bacterium]|nr:helix-turn-helix domain-containing protein [Lachnospiraceae bacterium]